MRLASLFSLIVGISLVALKAVAWSLTDSLSMMSSLVDSMLDVMASSINFVAIRYALQPPDEQHRFGHGKAEDLSAFAQSTFICGSGIFLIIEGLKRIFLPEPIHNSTFGITVMLISMFATLSLVTYQRYVVLKTSSSSISADAMHYYVDFISNFGVIVALILNSTLGWTIADPIIALIIAGYIIYGAVAMGKKAFNNLMDREFSDDERQTIETIVNKNQQIKGLHDLRTRQSGIYSFIQFHLEFVDENITLKQAHKISDSIEGELKKKFPHSDILIHQDINFDN